LCRTPPVSCISEAASRRRQIIQWLKMIKGIYQTLHRKLKIAQHEPKTGDELICSGNLNRSLVLQNIKLGIGNTRPHTGKNPSHHTWLWCYSQSRLVIYRSPGSVLRVVFSFGIIDIFSFLNNIYSCLFLIFVHYNIESLFTFIGGNENIMK
jgi:hypothetical protein